MEMSSNVTTTDGDALDALTGVLSDALRALADAGHSDDANRLAAQAYAALRREHQPQAQRINVLMHGLVRIQNTTKEQKMATADPQLDVRTEAPAQRHELIFDNYHRLTQGEGFVLVNDHDPKPLYYQFEAEHSVHLGLPGGRPGGVARAGRPSRMSSATRLLACPASDLTPGERRVVTAPGLELLVLNCGGQLFAIENRCSHEDAPLDDGPVDGAACSIECPRHGSRFDLRTGRALNLPAYRSIDVFDVQVVDGIVSVQID